jgi:hypothetical protein
VTYPSPAKRKPSFFVRDKKCFLMLLDDHHGDGRFAIWCTASVAPKSLLPN